MPTIRKILAEFKEKRLVSKAVFSGPWEFVSIYTVPLLPVSSTLVGGL